MNINQFSVPRSGGTFCQQVFWVLVRKDNVHTGHAVKPNVNVIVYRDFIAAFMSYYRVQSNQSEYYLDDIDTVNQYLVGRGAKNGPFLRYIHNLFFYKGKLDGKLILEYESDLVDESGQNRYYPLVDKICTHFDIQYDHTTINKVAEYCDISVNKKRAQQQGDWVNVDREHNIHGRQILDGMHDSWKERCSREVKDYLLKSQLFKKHQEWQKIVGKS